MTSRRLDDGTRTAEPDGALGERGGVRCERGVLDERAVSDVVGYVLVFALVTATIGTVFAVGFVGVEERQNAERVANVERAFDVLDDNVRDLQRYEDPSRATEIRLSGGTLSLEAETTMTLEYENSSGVFEYGNSPIPGSMSTLTYTNGDTTLAYEGGAWFRVDGDRATMRSPPRFVSNDNQTVLPVVRLLRESGAEPIRADGTVQVSTATRGSRTLQYPEPEPGDVDAIRLRIESPYADAWADHFDDTDEFAVSRPSDGEVVLTLEEDDDVFLRVIGVEVSLRR